MNRISKIIMVFTIMVFTVINSYTNIVIARNPNSSKGYADYDEVAAEEQTII